MGLKYKKILVAVDGSMEAEWAFKKAIEIAKRNNAKLILAHVVDTRSFAAMEAYNMTMSDRAESFAAELTEKYKQEAAASGMPDIEIAVDYGSPKVKIPKDIAYKYDLDLIICGATGLNAVERLLIGSVSEHITRSSPCDVLVVRTQQDE
ncbi:universal stress protein [Peribacillus saganii]|uniref:Universal stress protein n=1 Tax=Peribacillus saganii TaxID=2303992 RepID=A0A372LRB7_9BACI|nr:universal stress protein [Peribacillus saganii]RFU70759.1 universal stress protein [Peribacillus saganii]